jgi:hypothetical protein
MTVLPGTDSFVELRASLAQARAERLEARPDAPPDLTDAQVTEILPWHIMMQGSEGRGDRGAYKHWRAEVIRRACEVGMNVPDAVRASVVSMNREAGR